MISGESYIKTRPEGRVFAFKGFTTIELIVVILILGIISVVGGSRFFSTDRFTEMGYADTVANSLRYAHKISMASGCETRALVDSSGVSLFQRATNCTSGTFTRAVSRPGGTAWTEAAPSGVSVGSLDIFFDAKGSPYSHATSSKLTTAVSVNIGVRSVTVESETGYVHQ
ncbi:MAG: prepilin-type N-terminal cleavage/methylation domain-containing protein [Gammaproteobacteria bacterium]|nr:prepilin-type N-terminal cleavage/methylation domain-containing protein [Gammaproteobacteria bacterium]